MPPGRFGPRPNHDTIEGRAGAAGLVMVPTSDIPSRTETTVDAIARHFRASIATALRPLIGPIPKVCNP